MGKPGPGRGSSERGDAQNGVVVIGLGEKGSELPMETGCDDQKVWA